MTHTMQPLDPNVVLVPIAFKHVPVGTEFWWGGYLPQRCNWGFKRSNAQQIGVPV
jgi:hypothetical protein